MYDVITNRKMDRQYPVIDIVKFICAFLVVAIHKKPFTSYYDSNELYKYLDFGIANYLARIAVPFYFSAAGFLLFRKIDFEKFDVTITKNYIFRNLRLLGIWVILLFVGEDWQLWYMKGLIVAVCLLTVLLHKKVSLRRMTIIAVILYVIGLIGDSYYGLLNCLPAFKPFNYIVKVFKALPTTRNGIFMGFPFLLLGGIIEKKQLPVKPGLTIFGFVISMILLFCETFFIEKMGFPRNYNMYVFLVPAVFFSLLFAVNTSASPRTIYKEMRCVGIVIYFSHLFVYWWIMKCFDVMNMLFGIGTYNSLIAYFLTIIISTAFGVIIYELSQNRKCAFLRYLYS